MDFRTKTFKTYLELKESIKIFEKTLSIKNRKLVRLIESAGPQKVKSKAYDIEGFPSSHDIPLEQQIEDIQNLTREIRDDEKYLEKLKEDMREIESGISQFANQSNDTEYKIFELYFVQGLKQYKISKTIHMSERNVRRVISRIKNKMKEIVTTI